MPLYRKTTLTEISEPMGHDPAVRAYGWVDEPEDEPIGCPGDRIVTGAKDEMYPIKPAVFEATYAPPNPDPTPTPEQRAADEAAFHQTWRDRIRNLYTAEMAALGHERNALKAQVTALEARLEAIRDIADAGYAYVNAQCVQNEEQRSQLAHLQEQLRNIHTESI